MKKLVIFLFVVTLPVFAGNKPADEQNKKLPLYMEKIQDLYHGIPWSHEREKYHTMKEFQALPFSYKRKLTSGLSVLSGVGLVMLAPEFVFSGEEKKELFGLGMTYLGLGLEVTGCYLAFWSPKE